MELRFKKEIKDSLNVETETEKKDRRKNWYNELWDVTAKIGKSLAKTLCIVSVPVIVASCTCSRIELEGDAHMRDVPVDVSHEDTPDVHDAVEEDVTHEDIIEEDTREEELPPVCDDLLERSQINNLIGDYLNRRLNDRQDNEAGNTDAEYPLGDSDVPDTANPFTDGMGGSIGPSETFMHVITEHGFAPLASDPVYDVEATIAYTEKQSIWVRGSSYYSNVLDDVTGDVRFVAYTIKFEGESDDFGIRVCTTPYEDDYTYCKSGAEDTDYYATETHRLRITFFGEPWVITEMSPPAGELTNEMQVYPGGYVKLAKESVSGIVNQGESLLVDDLKFRLDDVEDHDGVDYAIISVLNEHDDVLRRNSIAPGQTKEFNIEGRIYRLHVWKVAPHYEVGAVWVDMSILSDEIKVEDGQKLDPDTDRFRGWYSVVGWKNKGASTTDTKPDHLRTIGIYADDVADVSSSGETTLLRGEGITFPTDNFEICYGGLDISDEERNALTFTLERDSDYENYIPTLTHGNCVIYAPYVKITSEIPFAGVSIGEENVDTLYVAMNGGGCRDEDMDWLFRLESGALVASTSGRYFLSAGYGINMVATDLIEDEISVGWSRWGDDGVGYVDPTREVDNQPTFVFKIRELAGGGELGDLSAVYFATDGESFNLDINYIDSGREPVFRSEHVTYQYAGPVNTRDSVGFAKEGYITERGSVFVSIDDTQVVYYVADRVAYSVYYIGAREE